MEQTGKVPEVAPIAPPEVSVRDTAELMNPGVYFNDRSPSESDTELQGIIYFESTVLR